MAEGVVPVSVTRSRRLKAASWVFIAASVYGIVSPFADLIPKHAFDEAWPAHARFHVTWAAAKLLALSLLTALIAWFPFRRGERWSWFALGVIALLGIGGLVVASLWHMSGPPAHLYAVAAGSLLATGGALAATWRPMFRPGRAERSDPDQGVGEPT